MQHNRRRWWGLRAARTWPNRLGVITLLSTIRVVDRHIRRDLPQVSTAAEGQAVATGGRRRRSQAGVATIAPILEASVEDWDWTMNVNVRAPFIMAQECAKRMIARGKGGKIVSTSSAASLFALHDHAAYCTSKAAINGLTQVMSAEWSKYDINCNTVGPTIVLTDMGSKAWGEPEEGDPMIDRTPLGRFAEPWEIAHGVVFLVSPSSSQMCGQMLLLDGGITTTGTSCGTTY